MAKRTRTGSVSKEAVKEGSEISRTIATMRKEYGDNSILRGKEVYQPERISTGSFVLDLALLGGIPANRVSMVAGLQHAGKSMLACKIAAAEQRRQPDKIVTWIDVEGTYDPVWGEKLGVDPERILIATPETGEQAVDQCYALLGAKEVSLVVLDSIAALSPAKEIDYEQSVKEKMFIAPQARLIGSFVRKGFAKLLHERKREHFVTMFLLNQFRIDIGTMMGDNRILPGGKALRHFTSVEIYLKNKEVTGKSEDAEAKRNGTDTGPKDKEKRATDILHNEHAFDIKKNKCNFGLRVGEFRLCRVDDPEMGLNEGDIDDARTMLAFAAKFGYWRGGGRHWIANIWGSEFKFESPVECIKWLYEDRRRYWCFRNFIICKHAQQGRMPTTFLQAFRDDSDMSACE